MEKNAYLCLIAQETPELRWVSTGAHFERRRTLDALSFWAPKALALESLSEMNSAEVGTREAAYREVSLYFKRFREAAAMKYRQVELQLKAAREQEEMQLKIKGC